MDKKKHLHDYSLLLIFLAVLDVFTFVATVVASLVDGTVSDALASVEPDILVATKVMLGVIVALAVLLTFAEAFIGFKGLKVCREPSADKGYIVAAKVFLVFSVIASVATFVTFFENGVPVVDTAINFANAVLDVFVYACFIKYANAVRADVLTEKK